MYASQDGGRIGFMRGFGVWWRDHWADPVMLGQRVVRDQQALNAIAGELGLSPDELVEIARRGPKAADELTNVFGEMGIEVEAVRAKHAPLLLDMQRTCIMCKSKQACRKALATHAIEAKLDEFCPNAVAIRDIAGDRGRDHHAL